MRRRTQHDDDHCRRHDPTGAGGRRDPAGGALAGSTSKYAQFAIPGILVQTVAFITMYTGVALNTDISKGVFDRFRSLPIWRPSVLVVPSSAISRATRSRRWWSSCWASRWASDRTAV